MTGKTLFRASKKELGHYLHEQRRTEVKRAIGERKAYSLLSSCRNKNLDRGG